MVEYKNKKDNSTKAREALVPEYATDIHNALLERGWKSRQLELLIPMIVTLAEMGCTQETIEILCVEQEFIDVDELPNTKNSFSDYRSFGIAPAQVRLLETKLATFAYMQTMNDRRLNLIKSICEQRQFSMAMA